MRRLNQIGRAPLLLALQEWSFTYGATPSRPC